MTFPASENVSTLSAAFLLPRKCHVNTRELVLTEVSSVSQGGADLNQQALFY